MNVQSYDTIDTLNCEIFGCWSVIAGNKNIDFFQADHTIMSWCIFSGMYKYRLKFGAYEFYDPVHADSLH